MRWHLYDLVRCDQDRREGGEGGGGRGMCASWGPCPQHSSHRHAHHAAAGTQRSRPSPCCVCALHADENHDEDVEVKVLCDTSGAAIDKLKAAILASAKKVSELSGVPALCTAHAQHARAQAHELGANLDAASVTSPSASLCSWRSCWGVPAWAGSG